MSDSKIKLAIVGVGKIVRDQHLPSIEKSNAYDLVATASRNAMIEGVNAYKDIESMLIAQPEIEAVALCMPPQYRYSVAKFALEQGLDVLLEKPPGATVCEVEQLAELAKQHNARLYTTWHSRHAAAVESAKLFLATDGVKINGAEIRWNENVRKWHPNQNWIWKAGGLGVFDPGINGLSILTHVIPESFHVESAHLYFPENKAAPIAAEIGFRTVTGEAVNGVFDWRIKGDEQWDIEIHTNQGVLGLTNGGSKLWLDRELIEEPQHSEHGEYETIYANFAEVVNNHVNHIDLRPLKLVADAFLLANRTTVEAFED